MVAGMVHHLRSLRKLNNDNWINTLLEEAQNERAHLFAWLEVLKPNWSQRMLILVIQGLFFSGFLAAYCVAPPRLAIASLDTLKRRPTRPIPIC